MVKNLTAMRESWGLIPGLGRSPEVGHGYPLKDSCWKNPRTEEPGRLQFMGLQRDTAE